MKQNENLKTGFNIDKLLLIQSSFERDVSVSFDDALNKDVDIAVEVNKVSDTVVFVKETVSVSQKKDNTEQFSIKATMFGAFSKIGETQIDMEKFGHINGAAIIFPFIREHISSLAIKAGLGIVLLPLVNFEKRWESVAKDNCLSK